MTKLKVVVRRLPPNLPEPIFWNSVAEWVSSESVTWKSFHPGKPRSRPEKPNVPSRAYIAFKTIEQVSRFSRLYDGHVFRDKQGNESFAIVEFAPFQKVPQERKKQDSRMGTIQQDDDFKSFLNAAPSQMAEPEAPIIDPKATPLLEALKAEKAAAQDAAHILSYHGHYKAAKADRAVVKATSKTAKVVNAVDVTKEDEAAVFSRKLNPDGTPAVVPKAILTKPESSSKGLGRGRGNGADMSASGLSRQSEKAKKKSAQSQGKARTDSTAAPTPATISLHMTPVSPRPGPASKAEGSAVAPEPSNAAANHGENNARPERERKRHVANPRMFEAALAGVGGGAGVRRRERESKKEKGEVTSGETSHVAAANEPTPTPSSTAPTTASKSTSDPATASASVSEKKDRQPKPSTRGGDHGGGKNTKRDRVAKPPGPPTRSGAGIGNGSVPAAPRILFRDSSVVNAQPATAAAPIRAENGAPDTNGGGPSGPAGRGSHNGRRGRGRGRGRGAAPSSSARPAASPTDS